jgi:hypothetical protein
MAAASNLASDQTDAIDADQHFRNLFLVASEHQALPLSRGIISLTRIIHEGS